MFLLSEPWGTRTFAVVAFMLITSPVHVCDVAVSTDLHTFPERSHLRGQVTWLWPRTECHGGNLHSRLLKYWCLCSQKSSSLPEDSLLPSLPVPLASPRRVHCGVLHTVCPSRVGELDGFAAAPTVFLLRYSHVLQPTGMATERTDARETRMPASW